MDFGKIDWFYLVMCGFACAKILGISHWGPWTWGLGKQMSRYWAYWTGIVAVIWAWGLWQYFYGSLENWLFFVNCNLWLHWPLWTFVPKWMERWSRPVSYGFASLPILAAYAAGCAWYGDTTSPVLVLVIYGIGGLCTLGFYRFDRWIHHEYSQKTNG